MTCNTHWLLDHAYAICTQAGSIHYYYRVFLYCKAGNFDGENLRKFQRFAAICESFLREIRERGIFWQQQQQAICESSLRENLISAKLQKFSPLKVSHYTVLN